MDAVDQLVNYGALGVVLIGFLLGLLVSKPVHDRVIGRINTRAAQIIADLKEADMSASPPLVAGHDGQGRWWRAVAGGDMVEVTETDARALVAATPGAKIVGHDLIEFLKRVNAPINLAGKVER